MIIIPELKTVMIFPPRTASKSFRDAIRDACPRSMLLYRHMEADGIPYGYERWRKVGVFRHPVDRLWSLYKYLEVFDGYNPRYSEAMRASVVGKTFNEWLTTNKAVFTTTTRADEFYPLYSVKHPMPETKKSQFIYLRPDLGIDIYRFEEIDLLARELGVDLPRINGTVGPHHPILSDEAKAHIQFYFPWDLARARP